MTTHATRESWLAAAVEQLRPLFVAQGKPLPEKVRVTCGWPSKGGVSLKKIILGETWDPDQSGDNSIEVFISPRHPEAVETLGTLAHELVHVALYAAGEKKHGHGKSFRSLAEAIGLEGPWKQAVPGPTFRAVLADMAAALGAYPYSPLSVPVREKKQTTRMLKCKCPRCGYTLRTTQKWIDVAVPSCPADESLMTVEGGSSGEGSEGQGEEGGAPVEGLAQGSPTLPGGPEGSAAGGD